MRNETWLLGLIVVVALACAPTVAGEVDEVTDVEQMLFLLRQKKPVEGEDRKWAEELQKFVNSVKAEQQAQRDLQGDIGFSFSGDQAGEREDFKATTQIGLELGSYPRQVRIDAGAQVRLTDGKLGEDVTSVRINYDYYFKPWLEAFGFVERFSDSFLSIDQRYEVGAGVKFEWNVFDRKASRLHKRLPENCRSDTLSDDACELWSGYTKKGRKAFREYRALELTDAELEVLKQALPRGLADAGKQITELKEASGGAVFESLKKKYSKLTLGLALSLFSEFEQAQIKTDVVTAGVTTNETFTPPAEQRFRWVLRPSFKYRPNDIITLKGAYYYKLPLDSPANVLGEKDLRSDIWLELRYKLGATETGSEKLTFFVQYDWRYDNAAPRLTQDILDELAAAGSVPERTMAEKKHRIYRMGLSIGF